MKSLDVTYFLETCIDECCWLVSFTAARAGCLDCTGTAMMAQGWVGWDGHLTGREKKNERVKLDQRIRSLIQTGL